jgi:pyrroline-5-carboxylate reductase
MISSGFIPKENLKGSEVNPEIAQNAQNRLGITVITDNKALTIDSDVIFVATKPNYVAQVL